MIYNTFEAIATNHTRPIQAVFEVGSVVLPSADHSIRIRLRYTQSVDLSNLKVGRDIGVSTSGSITKKNPSIATNEQGRSVSNEIKTMIVRMHIRSASATIPVSIKGPIATTVG